MGLRGLCLPQPGSVHGHLDSCTVTWKQPLPQSQAAVEWRTGLWEQCHSHPVLDQNGGFVYTAVCLRKESDATEERGERQGFFQSKQPENQNQKPVSPSACPSSSYHQLWSQRSHKLPRALVSSAVKNKDSISPANFIELLWGWEESLWKCLVKLMYKYKLLLPCGRASAVSGQNPSKLSLGGSVGSAAWCSICVPVCARVCW